MFDDTLRAGLAAMFAVAVAIAGGCDTHATIHAAAESADALSDSGKAIWPWTQDPRDRKSATPVQTSCATQ